MPLIEKISQMQKKGLSSDEIVQILKEEGSSPKEISEALDQTKVKSAVSEAPAGMEPSLMPAPSANSEETITPIPLPTQPMPEQMMQPYPPDIYAPQYPQQSPQQIPEMTIEEGMPMQELPLEAPMSQQVVQPLTQETPYYQYPEYSQYPEYQYAQADTETITEIAEQIVAEKLQKIENQISEITKFKIETRGKMVNIDERLRRIEIIIDRLQASIISKIGDYGKNIHDLKQEMLATQESFSKVLSPLSENMKELRKIAREPSEKTERKSIKKTSKRKKDNFERYLR